MYVRGWYYIRIDKKLAMLHNSADKRSFGEHVLYRPPQKSIQVFPAFRSIKSVKDLYEQKGKLTALFPNPSACRLGPVSESNTLVMEDDAGTVSWHWSKNILAAKIHGRTICYDKMTLPQFLSRLREDDLLWMKENAGCSC